MRTILFFCSMTGIITPRIKNSKILTTEGTGEHRVPCGLDILWSAFAQISQLFRLASVQAGRDGECSIHAHHAGIEVQLGHAFKTARRTFFDADAASFTVVDQNFVQSVRPFGTRDARLRTNQITVVAGVAGSATEAAIGLFDCLFFGECLDHFILRLRSRLRRQHFLLYTRKVREVGHVHPVQIEDDVDGNRPWLKSFAAYHFVQIEGDTFAVANSVDNHERLSRTDLRDIPRGEKVRVAEAAKPIHLDGAALVLEFSGQPAKGGVLTDRDDDVVYGEALRRSIAINRDRRSVNRSLKACLMQLQSFDFASAQNGGHGASVHKLNALFEHVVQIFRRGRHFLGIALDRNHGHFGSALPQSLASAVNGGVAAADNSDTRAQLYF